MSFFFREFYFFKVGRTHAKKDDVFVFCGDMYKYFNTLQNDVDIDFYKKTVLHIQSPRKNQKVRFCNKQVNCVIVRTTNCKCMQA